MKNIAHRSVISKFLSLILVLALMVCGMGVTARAETLTAELLYLDSAMNLAIAVTYTDDGTGTVPQLAFVSPSGEVFQQGVTPEDKLIVDQVDNILYFYIPDAQAGSWMIRYDSVFSGRLSVTTAPYSRDLLIEQFVINQVENNYAAVSFQTSFPVGKSLDYVIRAVTLNADGTIMGTKDLYTGYGYTNEMINAYVPLFELGSYSDYRLQLQVYVDEYGVEVTDTALSGSFGYDNPNAPGMMDEFNIILNRTTGDMKIDWTNAAIYNAEKYILAVYSSLDANEPVYTNTFTSDVTSTSILVDASADWLRVELSYAYSGTSVVSQIRSMTIEPNAVDFEIKTGENTSSLQAQISYNVPSGEVELYAFVREDEANKPFKISGSGTVAVNIEENDNTLYVAYKPTDHVVILESKEIFVDRKAPILTFFEDLASITTSEAVFRVAGMTEAGAVVTVNGTTVQINADGSFLIELNLVPGANSFEIVSSDPAGNLSRRTLLINRSDVAAAVGSDDVQPFWKTWLPLFIAAGASLAFAILVLVLFGGKKERTAAQTLKRWSILTWVLSGAGLGVTIWLLVEKVMASNVVNTAEFFEKVKVSIDEAYAALLELQFYDQWFLIALIVTAVLVVISIGLTVTAIIAGKNQNKPPKPPKAPKEPKPPKPPKQPKPKKVKPAPTPVQNVAPQPAPVVVPEPIPESAPAPVVVPEPIPEPAPAPVVVPESIPEPVPAPVVVPESIPEPVPAPVVVPEPVPAPAVVPEPMPEPVPTPVVVSEPIPESAPAPVVVPEPIPESAPAPVVVPEPIPESAPAPVVVPEPIPEPVSAPVVEPVPAPQPVTPRFCPNCGSRCVEGASFCVNCGFKLK